MIALFCLCLALFVSPFKSKSRLEAENVALRHQLIILRRKVRGRIRPTHGDRLFFVQLYRWFPSVLKHDCPPRDPHAMAPSQLPPVLALEIAFPWRPTANRCGPSRADPADERRQSAMGSAAHPWRPPLPGSVIGMGCTAHSS